jgi:hypothetical protein
MNGRKIGWMGLAAMTLGLTSLARAQNPYSTPQPQSEQPQTQQDSQLDSRQNSQMDSRQDTRQDSRKDVPSTIASWPENTKAAAQSLFDKYGEPDGVTDERISWSNKEPWSRVSVMREGVTDNFPTTHQNFVENTIHYKVPREKAGEILKFDPALVVDRKAGTLSARSNSEQANILALNLADDIIRGKRNVDDARSYMRNSLRLQQSGKSSEYTDHLRFSTEKESVESVTP